MNMWVTIIYFLYIERRKGILVVVSLDKFEVPSSIDCFVINYEASTENMKDCSKQKCKCSQSKDNLDFF